MSMYRTFVVSYANRDHFLGGEAIPTHIPWKMTYEEVLEQHSHRLWPESMPTCFQAVPISSLTDDAATHEEIFKKCYPKASMEPACFKVTDPIASEATAEAAVLEEQVATLEEPTNKLTHGPKSKSLVDTHGVIKPFPTVMSDGYKESKQVPTSPRLKKTAHNNMTTGDNMRLNKFHPYNFKPAHTTIRSDPIRGKVKPLDPTRKLYDDGLIIPVKPADPRSKLSKPVDPRLTLSKQANLRSKLPKSADTRSNLSTPADPRLVMLHKPADPRTKLPNTTDPRSKLPTPADPRLIFPKSADPRSRLPNPADPRFVMLPKPTDPRRKLPKPADSRSKLPNSADPRSMLPKPADPRSKLPNPADPRLVMLPKPADPRSKLPKPADKRSNLPKPADPRLVFSKPADLRSKLPESADKRSNLSKPVDPRLMLPKRADRRSDLPNNKAKLERSKLHPYNFKPADSIMRPDPIRGKIKQTDPTTRKLYNDGLIVPVKPADPRMSKLPHNRSKIVDPRLKLYKEQANPPDARLKHNDNKVKIAHPMLQQQYNATVTSGDLRLLNRKRKYETMNTFANDHKKWI